MKYKIVAFEGLYDSFRRSDIVPQAWLETWTEEDGFDNSGTWALQPPWSDGNRIANAVAKIMQPQNDWKYFKISRILAEAGKYQYIKIKCLHTCINESTYLLKKEHNYFLFRLLLLLL